MTTLKITGDEPYYPFLTSNSDWLDMFDKERSSPRSLVIEVGEDGSMPSENGGLIVHEVIY